MAHTFKTIYWGEDQSTEVVFEPICELPEQHLITAAMVVAVHDENKIVLSKPKRGWGIVGGHREEGETPEECVIREAFEEAAITLNNLKLVGRWVTKKRFDSPYNQAYPDRGYQLLYVADVHEVQPFTPDFEVSERAFVELEDVHRYHHKFDDFKAVFKYVVDDHLS